MCHLFRVLSVFGIIRPWGYTHGCDISPFLGFAFWGGVIVVCTLGDTDLIFSCQIFADNIIKKTAHKVVAFKNYTIRAEKNHLRNAFYSINI